MIEDKDVKIIYLGAQDILIARFDTTTPTLNDKSVHSIKKFPESSKSASISKKKIMNTDIPDLAN